MTPGPVPTGDSPVLRGRIHLAASMSLLLVGVLHLTVEGIDHATVLAATPLVAGAFVVLIVGTSRMLLSALAGLELPLRGILAYLPGLLVGSGSLAAYLQLSGLWPGARWGVPLIGLGLLWHLVLVASTLGAQQPARPMGGRPVRLLVLGSMAYAVASAVALPAAALGHMPWLPALHLVLPGFIVVTILAVLLESLPRFAAVRLPAWITWSLALAGVCGPGLIAAGLPGRGMLLATGAVVELTALALAGLGLLAMVLRARPWRDTHPLYALAGLSALAAATLGAGMATGHLSTTWAPLHGTVALFGFVGGIVFASSLDLYEPSKPLATGAHRLQATAVSVLAGAGVIFAGTGGHNPGVAGAAMALYAGAVALQLVRTLVLLPIPVGGGERSWSHL